MLRRLRMFMSNNGRQGTAVPPASFSTTLLSTLVPQVFTGSSTPTFTRATTAYVSDWEGLLKQSISGESRFTGARRVRNTMAVASNNAAALTAFGGASIVTATTIEATGANAGRTDAGFSPLWAGTGRCRVKLTAISASPSVQISCDGGTSYSGAFTVTSTPQVFSMSSSQATAVIGAFAIRLVGIGDKVTIEDMMVENTTGQSNTNPSEFVSVGVLSAPYHGAGVDGVKYFTTQNGNTVASNVVTEATGAAISSATLLGYQSEGAATNSSLWSNDWTNAAWVKTTMTTAFTSTGPDGVANSATRITATAGNALALQTIVAAASSRTFSMWAKRITGSGNFDLTQDGIGFTTKATTAGWTKVELNASILNATIGVRIATNGDAFDIWCGQFEAGAFSTSPIPTTTVAVTRNMDELSYDRAGNLDNATGTFYAEVKTTDATGTYSYAQIMGPDNPGMKVTSASFPSLNFNDGTTNVDVTTGGSFATAMRKVAAGWGGATMRLCKDAGAVGSGAFAGTLGLPATVQIGGRAAGSNHLNGNIRNLSIWTTKKTDAEMIALTT